MAEHRFAVDGVQVRLACFEPEGPGPFPAVVLLHGAGGNTGFWLERIAPALTRLGVALFAVHYFDRTATTRATPAMLADGHHVPLWLHTIHRSLEEVAARRAIEPARMALVGVSLGAFLSLALMTEPAAPRIEAIVDLSGGLIEPYRTQATKSFPPTLILHGDADTVVPVSHAHELEARLTELGVDHRTVLLAGEGHWFSTAGQTRILSEVASFLLPRLANGRSASHG